MAPNKVELDLNDTFISLWQAKLYQNVDLPGIVVCGDQSSGKSSVLEAISTLRFPTNDGMCTRFATRVEMAYAQTPSMTIQIDTDPSRSREECTELRKWAASIKETDFTKFGEIVNNVGEKLGTDRQGGFLRDALIVQAHGPKLPFFTFIDLPGLIHAPRDDQDMSDIDHIEQLVRGHLVNPHMIILAIVTAKSDLEIQGILKLVLEHDPKGERTIGVITKPDYCDDSPTIEKQAMKLLRREGHSKYHFNLGWHVVKNLKQKESHFSRKQRDEQERA